MCGYFRGKCYDNFMKNELIIVDLQTRVPAAIAAAGEPARKRFIEFFTANIRNRNTRLAYARAVSDFFAWCERAGRPSSCSPSMLLPTSSSCRRRARLPASKQHLAAIRTLFDWLVVGQVVPSDPASVVRGPKHVVKREKTPVLSPEEARELFSSIPTDTLVGLRDRALIGVLIYSFARVRAAVAMRVEDLLPAGQAMVASAS
jgi:site-specific recombinase XerD